MRADVRQTHVSLAVLRQMWGDTRNLSLVAQTVLEKRVQDQIIDQNKNDLKSL